jgi:hypothetical protein
MKKNIVHPVKPKEDRIKNRKIENIHKDNPGNRKERKNSESKAK